MKKSTRICFIAGTLGVGGAERQLYYIVSALNRLGAEVSLICLNSGEYWEKPIRDTGIKFYSLNGEGGKFIRLIRIIKIIRKIKPEIVQSQHFYTNLYAAIGAFFSNAISVGASRNELKREISDNGIWGNISFRLPSFFVANSMQSFDQAVMLGRASTKLFYLPNTIDSIKFAPLSDKPDKITVTLLAIGRLEQQKRFDRFIRLIYSLKKIYGNLIKGILIGNGRLEGELKKLAISLELNQDDLTFIDHSNEPEKYMREADIFVLTSEYEGTPNVVLEAMACGLPVISTRVGNLPNVIINDYNGFLTDWNDEQLTETSSLLINHPDMRKTFSINAIKTISEQFSFLILEKNLMALYNFINIKSKNK